MQTQTIPHPPPRIAANSVECPPDSNTLAAPPVAVSSTAGTGNSLAGGRAPAGALKSRLDNIFLHLALCRGKFEQASKSISCVQELLDRTDTLALDRLDQAGRYAEAAMLGLDWVEQKFQRKIKRDERRV